MNLSELIITDGITKIDLLGANKTGKGFGLARYVAGRPGLKGGGVWQDSPLATGRQLATGVKTNAIDALTFYVAYPSHAEIIYAVETLDLLLEKVLGYWMSTWQQTPVYLQAQAHGESNKRYALIHMVQYDQYFDPYAQPYISAGMHSTEEFTVGIERGAWLSLAPGEYESVAVTHEENSGSAIEATGTVFSSEGLIVGNMHQFNGEGTNGGLQIVLRDDGGVFSSNLLSSSPPYDLITAPQTTGDTVYFGSTLPFFGLVFDISALSLALVVWEFWNGSTWVTFVPVTGFGLDTSVFDSTGVQHARWNPSTVATWAKTVVSTDTTQRYWIRARTTTTSGDSLTQSNRHVYAPTASYVEVASTEIRGTLSAAARIELGLWRATALNVAYTGPFVWLGLRSVDRGENFVSQINISGGNPAGITVSAVFGNSTIVVDPSAPGGAHIAVTNETSLVSVATITFGGSDVTHFYGRFRLFARLTTDDDTGASRLRYRLGRLITGANPVIAFTGETKVIPTAPAAGISSNILVDLGYVTIPASSKALYTEPLGNYSIILDATVPTAKTVKIINIVLMPVDEWTAEITGDLIGNSGALQIYLDAIGNPQATRAYVYGAEELLPVTSDKPFLYAGTQQRLWMLFNFTQVNVNQNSNPAMFASVRLHKVQRYSNLRSD